MPLTQPIPQNEPNFSGTLVLNDNGENGTFWTYSLPNAIDFYDSSFGSIRPRQVCDIRTMFFQDWIRLATSDVTIYTFKLVLSNQRTYSKSRNISRLEEVRGDRPGIERITKFELVSELLNGQISLCPDHRRQLEIMREEYS